MVVTLFVVTLELVPELSYFLLVFIEHKYHKVANLDLSRQVFFFILTRFYHNRR
jgi:hypothetical protein